MCRFHKISRILCILSTNNMSDTYIDISCPYFLVI